MQLIWFLFTSLGLAQRLRQSCALSAQEPGWFWDGQRCLQCKQSTCICTTFEGCDSCQDNYYLDKESSYCLACPKGCSKCCQLSQITSLVCSVCLLNYQNLNGVCYYVKGCVRFSQHGHCVLCNTASGYYENSNGKCDNCPEGCSSCYSQTYCSTCKTGYYPFTRYNNLTEVQIQKFNNSFICDTCNPSPKEGCGTCHSLSDGKLICDVCVPGYFIRHDLNTCLKCFANCYSCQDPTINPQVCNQCFPNYILDDNGCQNCQTVIPHCSQCQIISNGLSQTFSCKLCDNEYYMNSANTCSNCRSRDNLGVKYCDSALIITQCQMDYILVYNSTASIYPTYTCFKNKISQCRKMDSFQNCTDCLNKHSLYQAEGQYQVVCAACDIVVPSCIDCISNSQFEVQCLGCKQYFYLNANSSCIACGSNCSLCSTHGCDVCDNGYYTDTNRDCKSCNINNCSTCGLIKNIFQCTLCNLGYGMDGNFKCWPCQIGCQTCNYKRNICTRCMDFNFLQMGSCIPYPDHCISANEFGFCYKCETSLPILELLFTFQKDETYDEYIDMDSPNTTASSTNSFQPQFGQGLVAPEDEYASFYKSVNGYCLSCSNYETGTFNCPAVCEDEALAKGSSMLMMISMIYIIY